MSVQNFFLDVLNMSITGGYIIFAVLLLRICFRSFPRIFSYLLWLAVYLRLLCPVSFTSVVSMLCLFDSGKNVSVPLGAVQRQGAAALTSSIDWARSVESNAFPYLGELSLVWLIGTAVMLIGGIASYVRLKKRVKAAQYLYDGVFQCDAVDIPFVMGVFKPSIYLPCHVSHEESAYILQHERIHLLRKDYIVKPIAYFALCLHWYNPLVWLSFRLMTCDMEMSCDEMVLHKMGTNIKKSYSNSLLQMAAKKQPRRLYMLAFGETDIKRRIKNVLKYKPPINKRIVAAVCLMIAILPTMLGNPKTVIRANGEEVEAMPQIAVESGSSSVTDTVDKVIPLFGEEGSIVLHKFMPHGYLSAGLYSYQGHTGADFIAPEDTEIYAAQEGTIVYASNEIVWPHGKYVIIDHGDGWQTMYAHCGEVLVAEDNIVIAGSPIAKIGKTGNANGIHCHFELRYNGEIVNPVDYIVEFDKKTQMFITE